MKMQYRLEKYFAVKLLTDILLTLIVFVYYLNLIKSKILYPVKNLNYPLWPKFIEDVYIEGNKLIKSDHKLLSELLFKGKWRLLLNGEKFILIDNKNPRYFIFGTTDSLKMLSSSDHMSANGTFKSSPSPFT